MKSRKNKKGAGRPKLKISRAASINIRLLAAEKEAIADAAREAGLSLSQFILSAALARARNF